MSLTTDKMKFEPDDILQASHLSDSVVDGFKGLDIGLVESLYQGVLQVLNAVWQQTATSTLLQASQKMMLKESLGRLFLWGETFQSGTLDEALDNAEELRLTTMELLLDLGKSLARCKSCRCPTHRPMLQC